MTRVNIVFTSVLKVLDFRLLLQRRPVQMNLWKKIITCDCTEGEIKLAQLAYEAHVEEVVKPGF
jgi:hypothetical protein